MCDRLLHNANLVSFEKFKYAFEAEFPFTNNLLIYLLKLNHYFKISTRFKFKYFK